MGVTAGNRIIEAINNLKNSDLKLAVIYDATASEIVDAAFDWIQGYYAQNIQRQYRRLTTRRISCGYGDLSIKYQQLFYNLLHLEHLGITMNKAYMLIPEKSATAVTGIEEIK
jgi:cobalamin-dependent methionine synthase I